MTDITSDDTKPLLFQQGPASYTQMGNGEASVSINGNISPTPSETSLDNEEKRERKIARNKLLIALIICFLFMIGEVVGGYLSGSLAIMTDAAHLLSDFASMLISLFALWLAGRPATSKLTFGYHRAEILGAMISVFMIWVLTGFLVYEAILRLVNDHEPIDGKVMFITAACGLAANIFMAVALGHGHSHGGGGHGHSHGGSGHSHSHDDDDNHSHGHDNHSHGGHSHGDGDNHSHHSHTLSEHKEDVRESKKKATNVNVRAAYIHVIGDLIQSIGVMIAAIVVWVYPQAQIVDPICTFVFSLLVLFTTITIIKDGMHVLMEGSPKGLDHKKLISELEAIPGVAHTHDLHIWSITMGKPAMAVHLQLEESAYISEHDTILTEAQHVACKRFGIHHSTIQIEPYIKTSHCIAQEGECNAICA